jgi:hypothetical protein
MTFDTKRQRFVPDICRAAQASAVLAGTTGIDYVHTGTGQIAAGAANVGAICFDLQYAPLGGQQRNTIAMAQSAALNVIPGAMLTTGRMIEVTANAVQAPCEIQFKISDAEPVPASVAQILTNSLFDADRPNVAVAADATSFKVCTYLCTTRFVIVQLVNRGAVATDYYLSVVARQP